MSPEGGTRKRPWLVHSASYDHAVSLAVRLRRAHANPNGTMTRPFLESPAIDPSPTTTYNRLAPPTTSL